MKAVILAGGKGSRLSEETVTRPKPMIEIGGRPLLWHILKIYSTHGVNEFIICLGYKGYLIKEYFVNYFVHMSDITVDLKHNQIEVHQQHVEPWRVTLVDTGEDTMTGGRLKRVKSYLGDSDFCLTYGDGVGNVDITRLIAFHRQHGKRVTVTAVQPPGRFGAILLDEEQVIGFQEKPPGDSSWINGGFFVLHPSVIDYIQDDTVLWEQEPMKKLVAEKQVAAYLHHGFWQPMDTLRDKIFLENLWMTGQAPWKLW